MREGALSHPVRYFIRDDDVGELTDGLRRFAETFVGLGLPVSYQIIPAQLTEECADYMLGLRREHPDLVEFGQHGLRHEMIVNGRHHWREFGPERSLEEQRRTIFEGREILRARLGDQTPIEVFTPPQHKYDGNTVRAAAAAGYRIFSGAAYPSRHHRIAYRLGRAMRLSSLRHHGISYHGGTRPEAPIREISIAVAVDDGGRVCCPAEAVAAAAESAARHSDMVGFMFHHAVYDRPEHRGDLPAVAAALARLGADRFRGLSRLVH